MGSVVLQQQVCLCKARLLKNCCLSKRNECWAFSMLLCFFVYGKFRNLHGHGPGPVGTQREEWTFCASRSPTGFRGVQGFTWLTLQLRGFPQRISPGSMSSDISIDCLCIASDDDAPPTTQPSGDKSLCLRQPDSIGPSAQLDLRCALISRSLSPNLDVLKRYRRLQAIWLYSNH